jgi:HlyD family secretion protein
MLEKVRTSLDMIEVEYRKLELRASRLKLNRKRAAIALSRAEATLRLAEKNLEAYRDLFEKGAKSQTELDIRILEKENAGRDVRTRKLDLANLDIDLKQIAVDRLALDARKRNARNDVAQAEQALAKAETNLRHASIRSPIAGVVLERTIDPGQTIAAQFQSPNLFKIAADLGRVHIKVHIDEADVGKVRSGQRVTFEVDAYRDATFDGEVTAVRLKHELRGNLVTYPVVIEAANPVGDKFPRGRLRPGMTAYVTFIVEKKENVARLPADALRFTPPKDAVQADPAYGDEGKKVDAGEKSGKGGGGRDGPRDEKGANGKKDKKLPGMPVTVYVAGREGKLRAVAVRVGENDGEFYELLSGELREGDEVVTGSAAGMTGGFGIKVKHRRRKR